MKFLRLGLLIALGACAHQGAIPPTMQNGGAAFMQMPQSVAATTPIAAPLPVAYVANASGNSIAKFTENAGGGNVGVHPILLSGTATKLAAPVGVTVDEFGRIYVANENNTITEYAAGATGDTAPIRTISCGGLNRPLGMAVDTAGTLYVANRLGNSISVFTTAESNCVSGNHVLSGASTHLDGPSSIVVSLGKMYVSNVGANSVTEYATTGSGDIAPTTTISGSLTHLSAPEAIAFDINHNIYVANVNSVTMYRLTASGNTAPVHTIAGSLTLLTAARGVQVSITGRILVINQSNEFFEYAANANGNVAPVEKLSATSDLSLPVGLSIYEPVQLVGVRLTGESATTDKTYGSVLGYFDGLTSTVSQIVHLTAGDPVVFESVDSALPHTLSFLNDATLTSAKFPASFDGSFNASAEGTSIGSSTFSTGTLSPGHHSLIYYAAPGLFTVGCAFHYDSNHMRTVIISK